MALQSDQLLLPFRATADVLHKKNRDKWNDKEHSEKVSVFLFSLVLECFRF